MKRMLVGIDGSSASLHALSWAAHLGLNLHTELVVVTAYVADQSASISWNDAHRVARQRLEDQWCLPAHQLGASYRAEVVDGDPGAAILTAAEHEEADLIVLSSRGRGGFAGLLMGSVADSVAHHTDRPLAIVPAASRSEVPRHVVVAMDASDGARAAVDWLAPIASALQADVVAVTVLRPPDPLESSTSARHERAVELLGGPWTEPFRDHGVRVETRVLEDHHPAAALLEFAEAEHADALVAGTRQVHKLRLVRLGGVTMQLLHNGQIPIVVVPPAPEAAVERDGDCSLARSSGAAVRAKRA